jgi:hypothetical protein
MGEKKNGFGQEHRMGELLRRGKPKRLIASGRMALYAGMLRNHRRVFRKVFAVIDKKLSPAKPLSFLVHTGQDA